MKTLAEFNMPGVYPVKWEFDGTIHQITYGKHVFENKGNLKASHEYGECVRHALECAGLFDKENYQ